MTGTGTDSNPPQPKVKALLFDIGGVCVVSPFQAIQDFEKKNNIPENWVNFAISRSGPRGAWQKLERGEITLDEENFFQHFRRDLHDQTVWDEYWDVFVKRRRNAAHLKRASKSPPEMDTTTMFWDMMAMARHSDPVMYPTLRYLRATYPKLILAALSNTVPFPPDHPYSHPKTPEQDPRSWFDVFISSSDVGLRKPGREIYELALERIGEWSREKNLGDVKPADVVFLDDIGENCKMGGKIGMQVIKVNLGRTDNAVTDLGRRLLGVDDLVQRVQEWERRTTDQPTKSRL